MFFIKKWILQIVAKKVARNLDLKEGGMEDGKKWYKSKTIISMIVAILISGVKLVDTIKGTNIVGSELYATIITILSAVGIYGRVSASTEIK